MSEPEAPRSLPQASVVRRHRLSLAWGVPLLVALAVAVFVVDTFRSRGPTIEIHFGDGASLNPGQSTLRFRGVDVGRVRSVAVSKDLASAVVRVELDRSATALARAGSQFWIVRPRLSLAGVSGLEALAGGPYIEALPGEGAAATTFTGLDEAPVSQPLAAPGLALVLESAELPSIHVGSPLTYRGVQVGAVEGWLLNEKADGVDIHVRVQEDHRGLVKPRSRFWSVAGVEAEASLARGIRLQTPSAMSLLEGVIAFSSPQGAGGVSDGTRFKLGGQAPSALAEGLRIALTTTGLGALHEHAPVLYRGMRVGEIEGWELASDARHVEIRARIDSRYAPLVRTNSRFWNVSGIDIGGGLFRGVHVHAGSVETVWEGGVAFATPDPPGAPAEPGARYALASEPGDGWAAWQPALPIDGRAASPSPPPAPAAEAPPTHLEPGAETGPAAAPPHRSLRDRLLHRTRPPAPPGQETPP